MRYGNASLLTLRARVQYNLRKHAEQEELAETQGEAEAGPIVSVFHNLEAVAFEIDIAVKVHFMERLHGNLATAMVLELVRLLLESEVVLDTTTGVSGLVVLAWRQGGHDDPEAHNDREAREEAEENGHHNATADIPGHP